jgi:hypothetical protein
VSNWSYVTPNAALETAKITSAQSYCTEYFNSSYLDGIYSTAIGQANWVWTAGLGNAGKHLKHFLQGNGAALLIN